MNQRHDFDRQLRAIGVSILFVGNHVIEFDDERKAAYDCDITYGTNNEFGFDYLRDNMKFDQESLVQGELNFAIVDEVDSILIDEARTPHIDGLAREGVRVVHAVASAPITLPSQSVNHPTTSPGLR